MPVISQAQQSQFAERRGTHGEVLLWVTARNRTSGAKESIGFWTGDDHRQFLVGQEVRTYLGSGSFLDMPPIKSGNGFQITQIRVKMAPFADEVALLVRGYDPRLDPWAYGILCRDVWWEAEVPIPALTEEREISPAHEDKDGTLVPAVTKVVEVAPATTEIAIFQKEAEAPKGAVRKELLGVRYEELLAFLLAAL